MSVRLGYCCISLVQREVFDVYTGRTLILASLKSKGVEEAKKLSLLNIEDLYKIIQYNEDNGIRFFRCTSNLFPHLENPRAAEQYDMEFAKEALSRAGRLALDYGHRITMHPGQFVQLGSPNPDIVHQSIRDLTLHARVFKYMGMRPEHGSVMIVHGGGVYGDKPAAMARWADNFNKLPEWVRQYVALENDEFSYSVRDLLPLCEKLNIPLCIDYFHHSIGHADQFDIFAGDWIRRVMKIWKLRGIKPKCHWSNQAVGERKGTHADCVSDIPADIMRVCKKYGCDIALESRLKDICLFRMLEMYYDQVVSDTGRVDWILKDNV